MRRAGGHLEQAADGGILREHGDAHIEEGKRGDEQSRGRAESKMDEVTNRLTGGITFGDGLSKEGDDHHRDP